MTMQQKVKSLIQQAAALPEDAQGELVELLVEMRLQRRGIYPLDDDERDALACSTEDICIPHIALDEKTTQVYAHRSG